MSRFVLFLGILLSLSLSSCIDIVDEIKLNSDKSGSVFIGIESELLGSLMSMIKEQLSTESINKLEEFPNKSKDKLNSIKGISEVKSFSQINNGRYGISFDFANPKALNNAYYSLMDMEKSWYSPSLIKIGKHKISRKNITPHLVKEIKKNNPDLIDSEYLKYLSVKTIIRLPSESTSVKYKGQNIEKNTKNVIIRYSFVEILKQEESTAYHIRF